MLMSAGLGTRMRPFTDDFPKPFLPLMGVSIAQYSLDHLFSYALKSVTLNVHHAADEAIRLAKALEVAPGAKLNISDERAELLGSAGGIRHALPFLEGERFFLMNGDSLSGCDLRGLEQAHARHRVAFGAQVTLGLVSRSAPGADYREIMFDPASGKITRLGEKRADRTYYSGIAVIEKSAVAGLPAGRPADFVNDVLAPAVRDGKAGYSLCEGIWMDIGAPSLWRDAHFELMKLPRNAPSYLRARVESAARRLDDAIWIAKAASAPRSREKWQGPCFWGGTGAAPAGFGPRSVSYNDAAHTQTSGIGFRGAWVGL